MTDLTRRRLLAAMACSPLLWPQPALSTDLHRIIALEWLPAELLLALGIPPLGVAETYAYRQWVREPRLPAGVIDVGLRTEPNLELLTQMQPSLLLYSNGYGPSPRMLTRIAPGMGFDFNDGSGKPLMVVRHALLTLGERLGLRQRAVEHLDNFDRTLADVRIRLARFTGQSVLLMTLMDNRHALVFGKTSLFAEVISMLGLNNAWHGETNFWGSTVVGIERLAGVRDARVICFDHDNVAVMKETVHSPLWQSLPFVRQQQFSTAPAVWFYGATLSVMNFCQILVQALETS
ncbi:Fe(3+)-hydroxamate ABC transporter substrate-binding protein FhuD [Enterobacteriaceae bacterium LUAb1]